MGFTERIHLTLIKGCGRLVGIMKKNRPFLDLCILDIIKKTVAAMFDGHAQSLSLDQTQDMRYWANNADRADWVLEKK